MLSVALAFLLVVPLIFSLNTMRLNSAIPMAFAAGETSDVSRAIAVAYDNSGSMVNESNTNDPNEASDKWCKAKYSLEVLAAMLDSNDTLSLYTMEATGQKLNISGSEDITKRVEAVHDADLGISDWTEPRVVREAYENLISTSADEKYLIITTDGKFNRDNRLDDVKAVVDDCKENSITVIYLAIGDEVDLIDSDPNNDIYVELASSDSILPTMVSAANRIFGRDSLPSEDINIAEGKLSLEVPMNEIIVFAQGESVQVGDLISDDDSKSNSNITSSSASVKYSDRPSANTKYDPFLIDEQLQGVVATYDGEMPIGTYSLDVSGATDVEVYYKPYVDIAVELSDENGMSYDLSPSEDNQISAGTYDVKFSFLDPFTGETLDSDLLYPATFDLQFEQNGSVQSITEDEQLNVSTGEATIIARADDMPGGVHVSQTYQGVKVSPALGVLDVDTSALPENLSMGNLEDESYPVYITKEGGEPLSAGEWDALTFDVEDESGIEWDIEKTDEVGTLNVRPQYINGDAWNTQDSLFGSVGVVPRTSEVTFTAQVDTNADDIYSGQEKQDISYEPDLLSTFLHWLPFLIILIIVLYFIYKYVTKPRLPRKMKPHLEFGNQDIPLRYSEKKISNKYSPWGPERTKISITPRNAEDRNFKPQDHFNLSSLGLVAVKKRNGVRQFVFDENTINTMLKHEEAPRNGVPPEYSPTPRPFKKGESYRNRSSLSASGSLRFMGLGNKRPGGGKAKPEEFTLRFK